MNPEETIKFMEEEAKRRGKDYMYGRIVYNPNTEKFGIVNGCYLSNDKTRFRFKVNVIGQDGTVGYISDWYENVCQIMPSDIKHIGIFLQRYSLFPEVIKNQLGHRGTKK